MKVKLTLPTAQAPMRANPTDAGADLFSPEYAVLAPHSHHFINLGVCLELEEDTVAMIYARSSLGSKQGLNPRNCVGVIDAKYRNELGIMMENKSNDTQIIQVGDRIAQLVISPVLTPEFEVVEEIDMDGDRGGGFGHTGK